MVTTGLTGGSDCCGPGTVLTAYEGPVGMVNPVGRLRPKEVASK